MYKSNFFLILLTILALLLSSCVSAPFNQSVLQYNINAISDSDISNISIMSGIAVQSMQTGQLIYAKNISQPFIPASNMKLYTAAAALLYLGPGYQYHTTIYADNNNIYLKFTGDPKLNSQEVSQLIWQLKATGIRKIKGNFYIDNSQYNGYDIGPGWMWDDLPYCYAAPVNAVIIDHNCIIHSHTAPNDNDPANHFPFYFAKLLIQQNLNHYGIIFKGKILPGTVDNHAHIIATQTSPQLYLLINQMLKNSDNLIANSLLKTLGANYFHQSGNWDNGVLAMQAILSKYYQIDFSQSKIVDGSGLSRYDLITPAQTLKLLNNIYHDKTIAPYFISALPIAGIDGTLKKRMIGTNTKSHIYAKTGTMSGVSALSGYIYAPGKKTYAFVIFINNFVGNQKSITDIEDHIVRILINF